LEVTAKFQAVQAAHEILSDPQLKAKYDADRAKQEKAAREVLNAFRRNTAHPTTTNFPPPSRSATTGARGGPFNPPSGRGRPPPPPPPPPQPPPSSGADKYAAFTRARGQPRERAEEEASKAAYDAMRAFQSMRNGHSQAFSTPPPSRSSAHPTAPRPDPNTPSARIPPRHHRSCEHFQNVPQTGFPGLSRTASTRKPAGFAPGTPGGDEPMAQRTSAYAHVHGQRHDSYFAADGIPRSPTMSRPEPATSPLKKSRSSTSLHDAPRHPRRPEVERISTQYAPGGGEKTYVNGVGRSASLRNSPVEREWGGHGYDDFRRPHSHHASSPRQQSASPNLRPTHVAEEVSSSDSSSSSDAESENFASRPKAKLRPRRQKAGSGGFAFRHVTADDPTMNSQFPPPNHKHPHSPQDEYTMRYEYPPPPPRSDPRIFPEPQPFHSSGSSKTGDFREHIRHVNAEGSRTHSNM
jgi:curved DNA-binding protein CbpA